MGTKCFLIERTNRIKRFLRRYDRSGSESLDKCPHSANHGYHNAEVFLDEIVDDDPITRIQDPEQFKGDARWPTHCACGYEFKETDYWQIFTDRIYRRIECAADGRHEEMSLRDAPPGAMWDAEWLHGSQMWVGPDGKALMCRLPNGSDWHIDGIASNCTKRDDAVAGGHKCWVRHGTPPNLTIDKNGNTCEAGGGSIQSGDWHGYLRNGELVT